MTMATVSNSSSSNAASIQAQQEAARAAAKRAAEAAAKKAAEAAAKKAAAAAAKKKAAEAAKRKDGFDNGKHLGTLSKDFNSTKTADIAKLAAGKGVTKLNKDGSQTTTFEKTVKGTHIKQELTTTRNKITGETQLKFEETRTTGNRETKNTFTSQKDAFGRTTSSQSSATSIKKGDVTHVDSRQTDTDKYGNKKVTVGHSNAVEDGNTTTTHGTSTTKGAFSTRQTVVEDKVEVKNGNATTTTGKKSTTGTDFSLSSSKEFKDGTFTLKDSADWKKNSFNSERSKEKEWKLKDPKADTGFTQKTTGNKLDKAQLVGDALGAAGLKKTVWEEKKWDTTGKPEAFATPNSQFVGSRVGTSGEGKLTVGANGVEGTFKREAVAGLYAEKSHETEGRYGKAGYQAQAKVEAKATFDAQGKLNANGLDVSVGAKAGVSAEASVKGSLQTKPVKFAGVDLTAGVEGTAKVSAEVSAEATGKVKITRNPPTAIAEGKVGASAVAKAEAEVKASAGPFAVKATGYASAGAEAQASGVIGYSDGKLKLGGSVGAALGVGLGGSVNVEVDVKAIGQMAKNTADVNGDGKLGLDDVSAAGSKAAHAAASVASSAASAVSSAASKVRSWMPW